MASQTAQIRFPSVFALIVGAAVALCCFQETARASTVVDATGASVTVVDHPVRIVTLAPSLAELASDFLGNDLDRIVGVTQYTSFPAALAQRTSVGPYFKPNLEVIVGLKPDLVLATMDGNPKDLVLHLRELHLPVVVVKTSLLDDIVASMRTVGAVIGASAAADAMVTRLKEGVEQVRARGAKRAERRKVLIELQDDPLIVAGGKSLLGQMVEWIGGDLLYREAPQSYPILSMEDAVMRKPEVVVVVSMDRVDDPKFVAMGKRWKMFASVPAASTGRIRVLAGDRVTRPTLRLLEGLALLEKAVYGGP